MIRKGILYLIPELDSIDTIDDEMKAYQRFAEVLSDITLIFLILAPLFSVSAIATLWMYYLGYKIFSLDFWH